MKIYIVDKDITDYEAIRAVWYVVKQWKVTNWYKKQTYQITTKIKIEDKLLLVSHKLTPDGYDSFSIYLI
jgi:hypothetical protein